jgi:hypothetical protein
MKFGKTLRVAPLAALLAVSCFIVTPLAHAQGVPQAQYGFGPGSDSTTTPYGADGGHHKHKRKGAAAYGLAAGAFVVVLADHHSSSSSSGAAPDIQDIKTPPLAPTPEASSMTSFVTILAAGLGLVILRSRKLRKSSVA